jgi:hypothetical protein
MLANQLSIKSVFGAFANVSDVHNSLPSLNPGDSVPLLHEELK